MFSQRKTMKFTADYFDNIRRLKQEIESADAIVIGAGAGLSTAAGFTYSGKRFENKFLFQPVSTLSPFKWILLMKVSANSAALSSR